MIVGCGGETDPVPVEIHDITCQDETITITFSGVPTAVDVKALVAVGNPDIGLIFQPHAEYDVPYRFYDANTTIGFEKHEPIDPTTIVHSYKIRWHSGTQVFQDPCLDQE